MAIGHVLGGAATGAALGLVAGPAGSVVGAVVGALGGAALGTGARTPAQERAAAMSDAALRNIVCPSAWDDMLVYMVPNIHAGVTRPPSPEETAEANRRGLCSGGFDPRDLPGRCSCPAGTERAPFPIGGCNCVSADRPGLKRFEGKPRPQVKQPGGNPAAVLRLGKLPGFSGPAGLYITRAR